MVLYLALQNKFITLFKIYKVDEYKHIITINPEIRFGKPCIRGMRISVYDVLSWLASGMSTQNILNDYPELTQEDILACLAYAADREHKIRFVQ